ncbi:MAG: hypothetical protein IJV42_11325 [Bacteroidaceae bacterium]|nr:hypothetical protein [Bacteroidaceae bacterium]MBQ9676504.1 hypothetical protein [Bacteroidaceae bacterium]
MNKTRQSNYVRMIAMAIATMGVIHIAATFTPLINGGLEVLSSAKQQAITYPNFDTLNFFQKSCI